MTSLGYYFGLVLGFLPVFLILSLIAIIRAKKGKPWVWFSLGCAETIIALIMASTNNSLHGNESSVLWFSFIILAIIVACIIDARRKKA